MQKKILFFILLMAGLNAQALNRDSLIRKLKSLPESQLTNPEDTSSCYLCDLIMKEHSEPKDKGIYGYQLASIAEGRLKNLSFNHPLINTYKRFLASAYNDIGITNRDKGDVIKALDYLNRSVQLSEEIGLQNNVAVCYNNIAHIYNDIGDLDEAIKYLSKGLMIISKSNMRTEVAHMTVNLGYFYFLKKQTDTALAYYTRSLEMAEGLGDNYIQALALNRIGKLYALKKQYDKAMDYYKASIALYEKVNSTNGEATVLNNIGECYKFKKNYKAALDFSDKSLALSRQLGNIIRIKEAALNLKEIHKHLGHDKEAYEMYDLYIQMRDSTNNDEIRKAALKKQLANNYETKEIMLKEEQERFKKLYAQKQSFYSVLTVFLVILVLIGIYFFYSWSRFKKERESKNLHHDLKERLKEEIKQKESIANSLIHIQEHEREKLAVELQKGVNQMLLTAKTRLINVENIGEPSHKEAVKLVETAIQTIRNIARDQGSILSNNKLLNDALNDLILQMRTNLAIEITFLNYGFNEDSLDQNQKASILRIIQELIHNSIEHSQGKNCFVSIKSVPGSILFAVTDDGEGINYKTTAFGNGLKNVSNKVALLSGKQRLFNSPGKGLKVFIEIPCRLEEELENTIKQV